MTLQECYAAMGGDFEEVKSRLRSERLVEKFALKFLADSSYDTLTATMASQDYEEAFRAAHTIKGVAQNLSFTALYQSASALSEALRGGFTPEAPALAARLDADYAKTVAAIRAYQEGCGK